MNHDDDEVEVDDGVQQRELLCPFGDDECC